ncbi:HAD hydrolase subfamily IA REG-2-like protein [Hymenopellis radicata]|nr:HAD hydrolase subfamily IA REG-2-like protein [Hymenopellis radicata]
MYAPASVPIRLVTFDVLHTLIMPRYPIHVQYSLAFEPFLGTLNPNILKTSFKSALAALQRERPAYDKGSRDWWSEVIYRTALSARADPQALKDSLPQIVDNLMHRFSSKEGYKAFDDAIPTLEKLHSLGVLTAVISNSDARTGLVLKDLDFPNYLKPILLSEEEGIEKPSSAIFLRALERANKVHAVKRPIQMNQCLHVGDELQSDYLGALEAGMQTFLLRRPSEENTEVGADVWSGVKVIESLNDIFSDDKQTFVAHDG